MARCTSCAATNLPQWSFPKKTMPGWRVADLDQTLAEAEKPNRLRKLLQSLAPQYDRIILDCPPGLGEISDQVFRAADLIVVPVPPTPLAMRSLVLVEEHLARGHSRQPW